MHIVFLYKLQETFAIGVLDSANAAVLKGATSGWVLHIHPTGVERYFIQDAKAHIHFVPADEVVAAVQYMESVDVKFAENPLLPQENLMLQELPVKLRGKGKR